MAEPENPATDSAKESVDYKQLTEISVPDLFSMLVKMAPNARINLVSSVELARALSEDKDNRLSEDAKMEYLKEYGRNERAVIKGGSDSSDDEDPLFGKK